MACNNLNISGNCVIDVSSGSSCLDFTITGGGTGSFPYVINLDLITDSTMTCSSVGLGVNVSSDDGNALVLGTDGGLFSSADPSVECACRIIASSSPCLAMDVEGTGTSTDPYVVTAVMDLGNSLVCSAEGLEIVVSNEADNQITFGQDGGLYVPPSNGVVSGGTECVLVASGTECLTLNMSGLGTDSSPYVLSGEIDLDGSTLECTNNGLEVNISGDAGNMLGIGSDGGLFYSCDREIICPNGLTPRFMASSTGTVQDICPSLEITGDGFLRVAGFPDNGAISEVTWEVDGTTFSPSTAPYSYFVDTSSYANNKFIGVSLTVEYDNGEICEWACALIYKTEASTPDCGSLSIAYNSNGSNNIPVNGNTLSGFVNFTLNGNPQGSAVQSVSYEVNNGVDANGSFDTNTLAEGQFHQVFATVTLESGDSCTLESVFAVNNGSEDVDCNFVTNGSEIVWSANSPALPQNTPIEGASIDMATQVAFISLNIPSLPAGYPNIQGVEWYSGSCGGNLNLYRDNDLGAPYQMQPAQNSNQAGTVDWTRFGTTDFDGECKTVEALIVFENGAECVVSADFTLSDSSAGPTDPPPVDPPDDCPDCVPATAADSGRAAVGGSGCSGGTITGTWVINAPGVYENVCFTGELIRVQSPNVTIINSRLELVPPFKNFGGFVNVEPGASNFTIENSDILDLGTSVQGRPDAVRFQTGAHNGKVVNNYFTGFSDHVKRDQDADGTLIHRNYSDGFYFFRGPSRTYEDSSHNDNIQVMDGTNITVTCNNYRHFVARSNAPINSAGQAEVLDDGQLRFLYTGQNIWFSAERGVDGNSVVNNNCMTGGGFQTLFGCGVSGRVEYQGNVHYPTGYGPVHPNSQNSVDVWQNNVELPSGQTVPPGTTNC